MKAHSLEVVGARQVLIVDADGAVYQQVAEQAFQFREEMGGPLQSFDRVQGWWDMRMVYRVDPRVIVFPVEVLYEIGALEVAA